MMMLKNIEDINSLINHQEKPDIKVINALKMNPSNFSKVIDNFLIIKRLYEEENKIIEFIVRLLRMSKLNLLLWIDRYFMHLRKFDELNIKHKLKEERVNMVKFSNLNFLISRKEDVWLFYKWLNISTMEFLKIIKIIRPTTMRYILDSRARWTLDGENLLNDLQNNSKIGYKKQEKFFFDY